MPCTRVSCSRRRGRGRTGATRSCIGRSSCAADSSPPSSGPSRSSTTCAPSSVCSISRESIPRSRPTPGPLSTVGTVAAFTADGGAVADDDDRVAAGLRRYREVYGDDAVVFPPGQAAFFDLMMEHLFDGVWNRPGLEIDQRRLLTMGVLAAQHRFDVLQLQFERAIVAGELTAE